MKSTLYAVLFALFAGVTYAADAPALPDSDKEKIRLIVKEVLKEYAASMNPHAGHSAAKPIMNEVIQHNRNFMKVRGPSYFQPFTDGQHPRATVVTCSDSRVHTHALDATPDGDLFMVRNIGNQIVTAEGSVEYGVHHLHTPLLLIVGHVACGAIKAASGDYGKESGPIKRELDTLQVPKGDPGLSSVKLNVHNQVKVAMTKFEAEVLNGHLTVVGAVYDFRNEMGKGQGSLNVVNINGETNPAAIAKLDVMQVSDAHAPAHAAHKPAVRRAPVAHAAPAAHAKPAEETAAPTPKKKSFIKLPEKPKEEHKAEEPKKEAKPAAKHKAAADEDEEDEKPAKKAKH